MNKTVIVKHLENLDGSQYTLHQTDRITPSSVAFAVDALCCPSNFKYSNDQDYSFVTLAVIFI